MVSVMSSNVPLELFKKKASILKNTLKTKTTVNFLICKYIRKNLSGNSDRSGQVLIAVKHGSMYYSTSNQRQKRVYFCRIVQIVIKTSCKVFESR